MILKKYPSENSVFFSNNDLEIYVQSNIGAGHIFEFLIHVNDELVDTQAWAKINDFDCYADFKGQFDGIFDNSFESPTVIAITDKTEFLLKKINITVKEYDAINEIEVESEDLPSFFIIKNRVPAVFNQDEQILLMSDVSVLSQIDSDSILMVPIWLNTNEEVTFRIADNNGIELFANTDSYSRGLYSFDIVLSSLNTAGKTYLVVTITDGITTIENTYTLKDNFRYPKTQIAIENTFGFYEVVSFFGKKEKLPKYKRTIQETYKDVKSIVDDDHSVPYKLNSGYLDSTQTQGLNKFNKSRNSFLYSETGIRSIIITTRNMKEYETEVFALGNEITFEDNHLDTIDEDNKYIIN